MNQDANSDYSITNDHDRNSECGSDSKKEAMGKGNSLNESLPGSAPQKRYFTQMGKSIKQLTGKYFNMISESFGSAASFLVLYKQSSQTDENIVNKKFDFNVVPFFLLSGKTKYLQPLNIPFFYVQVLGILF